MILNGSVQHLTDKYWRSGVISALLACDLLVVVVCLMDSGRFASHGLPISGAMELARKRVFDLESIAIMAAVFAFFVFALPMLLALLLHALPSGWPKVLCRHPRGLLRTHMVLSAAIAMFTIIAVSMEVLGGWRLTSATGSPQYSFWSMWLVFAFLGKPLWIAYGAPIVRKFLIRAAAQERPNVAHLATEVLTEEGGTEHVA